MEVLGGLFLVIFGLIVVGAAIALPVWMIHDRMTNTLWHKSFCVCAKCQNENLEREVRTREWLRMKDEHRRAAEEADRAARGR